MKKLYSQLKNIRLRSIFIFYFSGIAATIWFLLRVIPKPSRANYPCMKAAAPLMSGFVVYMLGLLGSALIFRKIRNSFSAARYIQALILLVPMFVFFSLMISGDNDAASALSINITPPPDGPNNPMGIGQGVFPGRVIWAWNKLATDSTCNNTVGNRYYLTKNFNQAVVDGMFRSSVLQLTGAHSVKEAWDSISVQHNLKKTGERFSYDPSETIFIKINQTTASWNSNPDYSDKDNNGNSAACQTSPPVVMSVLRQLIDSFGVPQENIYIADPISHILKYNFDYWHAQYPNVKYGDQGTANGRSQITVSGSPVIFYSDQGDVMPDANSDQLYTEMEEANYLINLACLKAHVRAGITLCAKNHFGSQSRSGASHLHPSLVNTADAAAPSDNADNTGYKKYRVQVDLMGSSYLGGNTMLSVVEGLWAGSANEITAPRKWKMAPFNNNWTNSIFMSIDQVALESVCFDFLRNEYNGSNQPEKNPNWYGVDDYLHQAADSANWPNGVVYDPDGNGIYLKSLGVHEHWTDALKKSYSRNLGEDKGIELIGIPEGIVYNTVASTPNLKVEKMKLSNYPNPFSNQTRISYFLSKNSQVKLDVYDMKGSLVESLVNSSQSAGSHTSIWNLKERTAGSYIGRLVITNNEGKVNASIKLLAISKN